MVLILISAGSCQNETKMCDTEIDLCYSFPCQNKGTCLSKEGGYSCLCPPGFTGTECEFDMSATFDSLSCPAGQCRGPSYCQPASSGSGFVCAGCPSGPQGGPDPHRDAQCRLRTRSFSRGSYLTFPSLKARNKFTIKLR
ncbi:cadherin EGF LAG seven-pass G-type receptor 2 [Elysia marginata]|uniref:Cadherin EGF LAG seven-pass G-type receptor 2 n=1 Tax=Elysia marginata TaxID=1093978 RepID=A0AAV4F8D8_9GAST|nr:cadherin EGF LAG seven-pass G-type receptor 2 [Elysia marginata]